LSVGGERSVLSSLKRNPLVLSQAIGGSVYSNKVVAEFPFGTDYRADFVAMGAYSGGWYVNFVEMEPPSVRVFTKTGVLAKRLNGAVAQVDSWRLFIEKNCPSVLKDLSKFAMTRELVWGRNGELRDNVGWPIYHPRSHLIWKFHIVVGRRGDLSDEEIERKATYEQHHEISVMTYDRLLDAAKNLDEMRRPSA
jgi:hypothetical protein